MVIASPGVGPGTFEGAIREAGQRVCATGHTAVYELDLNAIAAMPEWRPERRHNPVHPEPRSQRTPTPLTVRPHPAHREPPPVHEANPYPSGRRTQTVLGTILEPSLNHDDDDDAREKREHIGQIEIIPPASRSDGPTFRERMLDAMGADPSGIVNTRPTSLGSRVDMTLAERWKTDHGEEQARAERRKARLERAAEALNAITRKL